MRHPSEQFRDRGDPRHPSESETSANPFRGAPWPTEPERMTADAFAPHDVPRPTSPGMRRTFGLLPLLGVVLLVGAVSAYAGMTFIARWTAVATKGTPTETSATDTRSVPLQPLAAPPEIAAPLSVPSSSAIGITTAAAQSPSPAFRADNGEKSNGVRTAKLGIETAFAAANESGRFGGRQLKLVTADDGYEPTRTLNAMKELDEKEQVFGFVDNYGSPTALISLPYALEHHAIYFGAFTG